MDDISGLQELATFVTRVPGGEVARDYVIRGHLFIEAELARLIDLSLPNPNALGLDGERGMRFADKLALVVALGCIPQEEAASFRRLNKVRNAFAHHLDREVTTKDGAELLGALGTETRKIYDDLRAALPPASPGMDDKLKASMAAMWMLLRLERGFAQEQPQLAWEARFRRVNRSD